MITNKRVRELLDYDADTGVFTWKASRKGVRAGYVAGRIQTGGYRQIGVDGGVYLAHRLAFQWFYGVALSDGETLDHINGDRDDNRICNLRLATQSQNQWNSRIRKDNTSGIKGVYYNKASRKWLARVNYMGRTMYLGMHESKEVARQQVMWARHMIHGEYANHGEHGSVECITSRPVDFKHVNRVSEALEKACA